MVDQQLRRAADDGDLDQVCAALAAGADPAAQDDRQDSAFLVTGVTGGVGMLEAPLPANPEFALTNRYGGTALIPAGEHGHVEYVRAAVKTGIDVNHVNDLGWTALLEAVVLGDGSERYQEVAQLLVNAGADVNIRDRNGATALQHAESDGYTEIAEILRSAS
ncbi:ankyrin repeat domain-containing protein [Saccharopolyspora pogona]|uniref:ankyrin repeat domain-containing protein n=1 Tax=Saccharopolyspora pogona TaxID=333966 RepID=UPI001CC26627|nr:ankyrin repeat domain-containing protein [Saccharopolyspora pogona]